MSIKKQRYVFVSNMAAPYQVKFCYALQEYFDAEFWFYVQRENDRPVWWEIPLGEKCKVLSDGRLFKKYRNLPNLGYYSFSLIKEIIKYKPDIVLLGGFMIWHFLIMLIAKLMGSKVAIMSESVRQVNPEADGQTILLTKEKAKLIVKFTKFLFNSVDLIVGMG